MYNYQIAFKPTAAHSNADGLSRLPLPEAPSEVPVPAELVLLVEHLLDAPVKAQEIRTWTRRDPLLSRVKQFIQSGWPAAVEPQLKTLLVTSIRADSARWMHCLGVSGGRPNSWETVCVTTTP